MNAALAGCKKEGCGAPTVPALATLIEHFTLGGTVHSGVHHFLEGKFTADDQGRTLYLYQLLFLEIREQAADRLARSANHFRNFFMRERQFKMRGFARVPRVGRPGE
jgi:hypothetical protein